MRAPSSKVDNLAALGCRDHTRRFTGDHGLITQRREQIGLHNLALDDGRDDTEHRFAGEYERSFGHGPNVAGEAEFLKVVEKFIADIAKNRMPAQVRNLILCKMNVF